MAKYSNTVEYNIKTTLDMTGISKLRTELQQLTNFVTKRGNQGFLGQINTRQALADIKTIEDALTKAFNPKLGMLNSKAFNTALKESNLYGQELYNRLTALGPAGTRAFNSIAAQMGKIDIGMRNVSSTTDKIMNTLGNTVRWGLIASGFSQVMNAAHQAAEYVKDLDKSLTNIMMVSGETRDNMNDFAKYANDVAQRLGATTVQMTDAAKVFVQQGMSLSEASHMGEYAVHLANISEQSSTTTSDELTAMKNAFHLQIDDMGNAVSKWAAIANNAAVSMEELSVASQKSASVANTVGVDMEQFAGHIAAIEATTREAPENIGNGLKTLYSRFSDIKLGETLEDGVDYGQFSSALKKVGVDVLDASGKMRNVGDIIEDMMVKWQDLDQTQRTSVATTVAGRFQLARFEALMNSQDIYRNAVNVARNETGTETYDRMQDTYRESLEGKSKALQASIEEVFLNLFNSDSFNGAVDALTGLVNVLNDLIESVGGGTAALTALSAIILQISKNSMARGISNFISNRQADKQANTNIEQARQLAESQASMYGISGATKQQQSFIDDMAAINRNSNLMTAEEIRLNNQAIEERARLLNEVSMAEQTEAQSVDALRGVLEAKNLATKAENEAIMAHVESLMMEGDALRFDSAEYQNSQKELTKMSREYAEVNEVIQRMIGINHQLKASTQEVLNVDQAEINAVRNLLQELGAWTESNRFSIETQKVLTETTNLFMAAIEAQSAAQKDDVASINAANKAWQEYLSYTTKLQVELSNTAEGMATVSKNIKGVINSAREAGERRVSASTGEQAIAGAMQNRAEQLNTRKITKDVIALGQAATTTIFAFQSLSGIFKTINDDSLSLAEKFEHIAMNMGMLATMGIPAITQTKDAVGGLRKTITEAETALSMKGVQQNQLAAMNKTDVVQKISALGISNGGAIGGDISDAIKNEELLNEAKIKSIATNNKCSESDVKRVASIMGVKTAEEIETKTLEKKNVVDLLSNKFSKTKIGTLIAEKAAQLAANLQTKEGVAANLALAAAERVAAGGAATLIAFLGPLAAGIAIVAAIIAKINEESEAEEKRKAAMQGIIDTNNEVVETIKNNKDNLEALYSEYLETGDASDEFKDALLEQADALGINNAELLVAQGNYRTLKEDIDKATIAQLNYNNALLAEQQKEAVGGAGLSDSLKEQAGIDIGIGSASYAGGTATWTYSKDNLTAYEELVRYQEESKKLSEDIEEKTAQIRELELDREHNADKIVELQDSITKDLDQQIEYNKILQEESNTKALEAGQSRMENDKLIALSGEYNNLLSDITDLTDLESYIKDGALGQGIKEYYEALGPEAAYAFLATFAQQLNDSGVVQGIFSKEQIQLASIMKDAGQFNKDLFNTIDWKEFDFSSITPELLKQLGFDSYQSFMTAFEEASKANPLVPTLDIESAYDFDSDQEINDYLENNTNIDRDVLDLSTSLRIEEHEETGNNNASWLMDQAKAQKHLQETIEEATKAHKDYGEESIEAQRAEEKVTEAREKLEKVTKDTSKDTKLYEKAVQRAAAAEARQAKTLEEMNNHFEDNAEVLKTADKSSIEYAEALSETKKDLAGLLDIDAASLSNDFAADAHTLNLMQESMEGNTEAYEELCNLAAQDLISQIEIPAGIVGPDGQEFTSEYAQQTIQGLIDSLQSQDLGIDVEADIGTQGWYDRINELLASGAITADQLTQVLSAAGYEGEITTEKGQGKVPKTTYTITPGELINVGSEENPVMFPGNFTMEPVTEMVDSEVDIPVLKGATQKGGLVNNAGGGGNSGGGGGGGGGGSKAKEPKKVKRTEKADSEFDIYNKVNSNLKKNEDLLDKIDKRKSRLSGSRYKDTLVKENDALKQQNKILTERNKIANAKADALRTGKDNPAYGIYLKGESLNKYGLKDSDKNGTVDNYKAIYNKAYAAQVAAQKAADDYFKAHGGAFDKYGNTTKEASMTEEESEAYTKLVEKAKERAEYANGMKKVIDDYQDTMDQIRDDTQKIQDNMDKIQDNIIEVWKYARKAGKEFGDMKDDITDTKENLATMWGDDPTKSLGFAQERFTNLFKSDTKLINDRIKELRAQYAKETDKEQKAWLKEQIELAKKARDNGTSVLDLNMQNLDEVMKAYDEWKKTGKSKLFGNNEQAMFEALEESFKDGVEYAEKIKDTIEGIRDAISEVMDEIYDGLDDRLDQFEQINDAYEHIRDMSELIYGDQAYATQAKMFNAEAQAGENRLQTLEKAREENHKMLESLEEGSEEYKKALKKERDLDQDILSTRKDIVQAYKDAKEAANNLAVQNWQDNFTATINGVDGIPIQYAADQWERIKENADLYLDDLNRAWELEKLQNEYQKLLNDATDPKIQQQITQQMEQQLGYLRDKNALSKYDVEYANAQLEILQKTIALEEARDNKNKMKLRRDSQGNYEYVYTADQNATKDAENELLDAQMNGYNISVAASREATDNYFQKIQDMADKLRNVANDATLSAEQVEAITQDIIKSGYDFLDANAEQLNTAQINAVESFIKAAQNLAEENATRVNAINQELIEGTNTNADLMTTVLHSAVQDWIGPDGLALFRESAEQTKQDIKRNINEFVDSVSEANTNVSIPLNDLQYQFDTTTDNLNDLNSSAHDFYNFLEDKSGIVRKAANDLAYYQKKMTDMNNKMNAYYRSWNEMSKQLESQKAINSQLTAQLEGKTNKGKGRGNSNGSGSRSGSGSGGNGSNSGKSKAGQTPTWNDIMSGAKIKYVSGDYLNSSYGDRSSTGHIGLGGEVFVLHTNQGAPYPVSIGDGTYQLGWVALNQLELMKSGGYTGEWGEEGKIAMLHQKELVLNAADTENMLAAVEVVREIVNSLKGINSGASLAALGRVNSSMPRNNVEQRVEIKAEFPNVQSSTEIENALISLSNDAYIYAQDKNETFI